uniref:Arp2/3 complex 34 kDa subunit n=1 Tax=Strongyloides venezuelensis TaxID=75913 RepID=A0A0K0FUF5_STRVS
MVGIETQNRIIVELLLQRFSDIKSGQEPKKICHDFCDFDGVVFNLVNENGNRKLILLSIHLKYFKELKEYGAMEVLKRIYGNYLLPKPLDNYDVTLRYDLDTIPDDYQDIITKASLLKRNCFAAVFEKYFRLQQSGEIIKEQAVIHYRDDETLYVEAKQDRVTVIIATQFADPEDAIYGNIFLQEYVEGRKINKTSPQIIFSNGKPPAEMANITAPLNNDECVFYVAFVLEKRHTAPNVMENTIDLIHIFRDDLHYHIKCSRRYVHSRMVKKADEFVKIIERSRIETNNINNKNNSQNQVKKGLVRRNF